MDRRERLDDPVEAVRAALDGYLAETWTSMPGIVQSFDPDAMTVTVQPSIRGRVSLPDGSTISVNMPLLVDVPVIFPSGGGFTLTFPITEGDECLVIFADRCIDAWWQSGGVAEPLEPRMHNLSDGFALVGPFSQARVLPNVSVENVQLRTDDGAASVTIKPDYTISAYNPVASITMTPGGEITGEATTRITLKTPILDIATNAFNMSNLEGGAVEATIKGNINQDGSITSTGDHVAGNISLKHHKNKDVQPGSGISGEPV
jgi:hypothetical protein